MNCRIFTDQVISETSGSFKDQTKGILPVFDLYYVFERVVLGVYTP